MDTKSDLITYVVFGATGNLAQLKIFPALCSLYQKGKLPKDISIIAFSRRELDDESYRDFILNSLKDFDNSSEFVSKISYISGVFEDINSYTKLKNKINGGKVYYHLAVLPESYESIINNIGKICTDGQLLIEKPFGNNEESALELENTIEKYFTKDSIYRIDHYLAKLGVESIINKKKGDPEFESKFNNTNVSRVLCRFREVIDVSGRGEFYDKVGAFKDMGQSHGLEVLATLLMNLKDNMNSARKEILESLMYVPRSFIRGQYNGYTSEKGVSNESDTETYFRVSFVSSNERWSGVDIVLEAGKALENGQRIEDITIEYNDESTFSFNIDIPKHYNAYENVIDKAIKGDKSVFVSFEEVLALWRCADNIIDNINNLPLVVYEKGKGPNFI